MNEAKIIQAIMLEWWDSQDPLDQEEMIRAYKEQARQQREQRDEEFNKAVNA